MIAYLRDKLASARLRARQERVLQEQMMELLESRRNRPATEEAGDWRLLGGKENSQRPWERIDQRRETRRAVQENPHARHVLRLLEAYVVGEGFRLTFTDRELTDKQTHQALLERVGQLWEEFLQGNRGHFSYREFARRVWRDGECFLRIYPQLNWPPEVRFIDPEWIGSTAEELESDGIETASGDVETPRFYLKIDPRDGSLQERIPAEEVLHCKYGVDSNEKRGRSFFSAILEPLEKYQQWQEIELQARKLQSSIVLWRKVQGGPTAANNMAEAARNGSGSSDGRSERIRPGTILTTSAGTEIKYLQPDTNFGDAAPLGRMLLLSIAAGAGIPEFMLTSDAANGNYSSTMVAEGPAVKLFQCEQRFFAETFTTLWRRLLQDAISLGLVAEAELGEIEPRWSYPQLVNRDRPRERQADVQLLIAGVLSKAEIQRREQLDPQQIQAEIEGEKGQRGGARG